MAEPTVIAIKVQGTKISVKAAGDATAIDLGCVIDGFSGPGGSKPEIDTTTLCSTGDEFISGLPNYGSVSFTGLYNPQSTKARKLKTLYDNGETAVWVITFTDKTLGSTWTFSGYVSEFTSNFQKKDAVRISGSIRVSGSITEAVAA